jgi:hypothetical protein
MGDQSGQHFEANGVLPVKTTTHPLLVLDSAIIRPTVTFRPEFVKDDRIRRIADRKPRLPHPNRVFRIFTETQSTGAKSRIKQTDLRGDFSLE